MTHVEMERFTKEFLNPLNIKQCTKRLLLIDKIEVLGEGSFGVVFKAKDNVSGKMVALKRIKHIAYNERVRVTTMREVNILRTIQHENIIQLRDVLCTGPNMFFLVFEFFHMDLKHYLNKTQHKPQEDLVRSYSMQLMKALAFTHKANVMHRDLKPENILVDQEGNLKLADFGLSLSFMLPLKTYTPHMTSLWYRAPEVIFGCGNYGPKIDMWAAGCVISEMIGIDVLFRANSEIQLMNMMIRVLGKPDPSLVTTGCQDMIDFEATKLSGGKGLCNYLQCQSLEQLQLMQGLIIYNPVFRMSAAECLITDYLKNAKITKPM